MATKRTATPAATSAPAVQLDNPRMDAYNGDTFLGTFVLQAKAFSTGSRGYHSQGKLVMGGKGYQFQLQLVEIGSKPR